MLCLGVKVNEPQHTHPNTHTCITETEYHIEAREPAHLLVYTQFKKKITPQAV